MPHGNALVEGPQRTRQRRSGIALHHRHVRPLRVQNRFHGGQNARGEAGKRQVDNARLAIQENGGGLYGIEEAGVAITILAKQ